MRIIYHLVIKILGALTESVKINGEESREVGNGIIRSETRLSMNDLARSY